MLVDLIDFSAFSDLKAIKETAAKLDTGKVILAKRFQKGELPELKKKCRKEKLPFLFCHIMENSDSNELKRFRQQADFLAVRGGIIQLNKFAVSNKNIDFLLHPVSSKKFEVDTAIARLASQNKVRLAFLFQEFLSVKGVKRSLMFKNAFMAVKLLKKFKGESIIFSGAKEKQAMRALKDLAALNVLLGFSPKQAERLAEKLPGKLVEGLK
jgi:RNase P/RNase MRP subunit p30